MSALAPMAAAGAVVAVLAVVVRPDHPRPDRRRPVPATAAPGAAPGSAFRAVPAWFARRAVDADLAPVERWWTGARLAVACAALGGWRVGGPTASVVAGLGAAGAGVVVLAALGHRREDRLVRSVPEALDAVARACRAGASVHQALRGLAQVDVGPAGPLLAEVATRVDRGRSLDGALADLVAAHPVPPVRLAAVALLVGAETGAAPARAVDGVAATLRDHAALDREAQALATQAKASVAVLVLAPVGFGALAVAGDPRVATFLFREPAGMACLAVGLVLDALGAWWMHRLVRRRR
ncbi:type II secretion system F family protein [Actinomarinicola tropica]|uniref:Type II secretion system protein GspF domain-containing protein n=1 Tax=Actinomarinicola tropica TaxID=2789776 RepID=A0A5Q2RL12_9ACTN|nr:type II secretion system F family protein [Actinomarinicola tropica]QGG96523.1 hypothetical protein GH723_16225 [Actinomarinicola tropica]